MYILDQTNEWDVDLPEFDIRDAEIRNERKMLFNHFIMKASTLEIVVFQNKDEINLIKLMRKQIKNKQLKTEHHGKSYKFSLDDMAKNLILSLNHISGCTSILYDDKNRIIAEFNTHVTFYEEVGLPCKVLQVNDKPIQVDFYILNHDNDRDVHLEGQAKSYFISTDYDHIERLAFETIEKIYSYPLSIYVETHDEEQEQMQKEWANYDVEYIDSGQRVFTLSSKGMYYAEVPGFFLTVKNAEELKTVFEELIYLAYQNDTFIVSQRKLNIQTGRNRIFKSDEDIVLTFDHDAQSIILYSSLELEQIKSYFTDYMILHIQHGD
ncbi:hypothetical protein SAMN05880501_1195 [Ureibacillus xyleni]|uniref:Uncharacterized protein n=1 Tax=Ureibacillus xyleni TaxID=614648 RepID=A0A285TQH3_9BACL|nr:hypothetical protein [Ureibacillus xyleni]SOC25627.1 hypothetical protein SAMN05880501_1195 [Ureibacillus xyleni]